MRREGRSSKKLQVHSSSSMSVEAAVFVQIWEWKGMRAGACNEHVYFPGPFSSSVRPGFEPEKSDFRFSRLARPTDLSSSEACWSGSTLCSTLLQAPPTG